ncbi:hypothetical protein ACL2XO_00595 [Sodalis sp. RH15]|uniref:hypothetical protein n=1 Tax=Sodalis sp. RH15 TaxID=3394330 RepID=UPI0039B47C18
MNTIYLKKLFFMLTILIAFYSAASFSIDLTPNTNGGSGQLPSGYSHINFTTANGNWVRNIALPLQPNANSSVTLISHASYNSFLDARPVGLGPEMEIIDGDTFTFTFDAGQQRWIPSGAQVTSMSPNSVGPNIPNLTARITIYEIYDGNWAAEIRLPSQATPQNLLLISSRATNSSRLLPDYLLFASTTNIRVSDNYGLQYRTDLQRWVITQPPVQRLDTNADIAQMPPPIVPLTEVNFSNQHFISSIQLPQTANNRDEIIIRSTATSAATISNANTHYSGPMELANGNEYHFFYITENPAGRRWQLISSPIRVYTALNLPSGVVPTLRAPRTRIELSPGNFRPQITLREGQLPGARVIINNNAAQATSVLFSGLAYSALPGEVVSFRVGENGLWQKETITVDLLMIYSDLARSSLGQAAIEARNIEAFGLINDGLENSGANFRVRLVGLNELAQPEGWTSLSSILPQLVVNPEVQGLRNAVSADAVNYITIGLPLDCGLAYVNTVPNASTMVAAETVDCATTGTRHEFGHNMGIHHGDERPTPLWARGDQITRTIMAGNAIPFYSTPQRYTAQMGIPMGAIDSVDAVRMMNTNSPIVAAFR